MLITCVGSSATKLMMMIYEEPMDYFCVVLFLEVDATSLSYRKLFERLCPSKAVAELS